MILCSYLSILETFIFLFYSLLPFLLKVVEEQEINEGKRNQEMVQVLSNFCHPHEHHSSICWHKAFFLFYINIMLSCFNLFGVYILNLIYLSSHDAPASDVFEF